MNFLINEMGSPFFPIGSKNPNFGNTTAFADSNCKNIFLRSLEFCEHIRVIDFLNCLIFGKNCSSELEIDDGDVLISYSITNCWIFVYDVSLEIGIVFHRDRKVDFFDIDNYNDQNDHFRSIIWSMVNEFPNHYNGNILQKWIEILDSQ